MDREAWQATVHRVAVSDTAEATLHAWMLNFFSLWQLCLGGDHGGMEVPQLLGSWGPWQCQLHKSTSSYCHRRYSTIRAFSNLSQLCPSEN